MPVIVEKKITAKKRQQRVAVEYEKWLKKNPKANRKKRIAALDAISDSAYLQDHLDKSA